MHCIVEIGAVSDFVNLVTSDVLVLFFTADLVHFPVADYTVGLQPATTTATARYRRMENSLRQ